MAFFPGLHPPHFAHHFDRRLVATNSLRRRKRGIAVGEWTRDAGAFTELAKYGRYRHEPEEYAAEITRWATNRRLLSAVTPDVKGEPPMLERTGLAVADHQRLTIERDDRIRAPVPPHIHLLPVLQGCQPSTSNTSAS